MAVMSNQVISQDIVLSILSLLPVKSLFRFKSVSKEWLSLIDDPFFIKLHLKQSVKTRNNFKIILKGIVSDELLSLGFASVNYLDIPKELNHTKLVGSWNGILCLLNGSQTHRSIMLWNISTEEYKVLPDEPMELPYSWDKGYTSSVLYGFGYDSFNDDYKVVRIAQKETKFSVSPLITEVKIYSLKTNSWRSCEEIPNYYVLSNCWGMVDCIFVCGALHWFGRVGSVKRVMAFDVAVEKHHTIELLDNMERGTYNIALGALRGCLCAMATGFDFKVQVWMMKDYGVKESWTIMHCLQNQHLFFAYLKLLWCDEIKGEEFKDEASQLEKYRSFAQPVINCTESLVKLVDKREQRKRSRRQQN
ncbi:hypothetical protein PTKIN_Ptkin01aG0026500 [Pterospermum kingtungense]